MSTNSKGKAEGKDVADILVEINVKQAALDPRRVLINYSDKLISLPTCSKRLRLDRIWPLFGAIVFSAKCREMYPTHEWVTTYYVDRSWKRADSGVVLQYKANTERNNFHAGLRAWWPTAPREKDVSRLHRRLLNSGFLLETALGLSLAIRKCLYNKDFGLTYYDKLVTDLGVCTGRVRIHSEDRIYTVKRSSHGVEKEIGDPDDHYWLYFSTSDGETVYFDFGLHLYNFHLCPVVTSFVSQEVGMAIPQAVPAYQQGRQSLVAGSGIKMHFERDTQSRYSIARSPIAEELADNMPVDPRETDQEAEDRLYEVSQEIRAGRHQDHAPPALSNLAVWCFYSETMHQLEDTLKSGRYKNFPISTPMAIVDED